MCNHTCAATYTSPYTHSHTYATTYAIPHKRNHKNAAIHKQLYTPNHTNATIHMQLYTLNHPHEFNSTILLLLTSMSSNKRLKMRQPPNPVRRSAAGRNALMAAAEERERQRIAERLADEEDRVRGVWCSNCNRSGHDRFKCRRCVYCKKEGHNVSGCPRLQNRSTSDILHDDTNDVSSPNVHADSIPEYLTAPIHPLRTAGEPFVSIRSPGISYEPNQDYIDPPISLTNLTQYA